MTTELMTPGDVTSTLRWLESWRAGEDVERPRALIQTARSRIDLAPASPQAFAVAMDRLLDFAEAFGLKVPKRQQAVEIYREALRVLPEDLLMTAVERTIADWKWSRLPPPADIRAQVTDEMGHRILLDSRARLAVLQASRN